VKGFTSGIVNFMPNTCTRILKHLQQGQLQAAADIVGKETTRIYDLRGKRPGYRTLVIKEAMNICGLNAGAVRPPLAPLPDADLSELRCILDSMGLLKATKSSECDIH